MQIRLFEVDDTFALAIGDISILDVPFFRHSPVKNWGACWYFVNGDGQKFLHMGQSFTHAIACNAAADGEQGAHQCIHLIPDGFEVGSGRINIDHL